MRLPVCRLSSRTFRVVVLGRPRLALAEQAVQGLEVQRLSYAVHCRRSAGRRSRGIPGSPSRGCRGLVGASQSISSGSHPRDPRTRQPAFGRLPARLTVLEQEAGGAGLQRALPLGLQLPGGCLVRVGRGVGRRVARGLLGRVAWQEHHFVALPQRAAL
jgi:hypothetical protein